MNVSKYIHNHSFFKHIDDEPTAYLLGIIAGDGCIRKSGDLLEIYAHSKDTETLKLFNNFIGTSGIKKVSTNGIKASISSKNIVMDVCNVLGLSPGAKHHKITLPTLEEDLSWHFIRGLMDSDGWVAKNKGNTIKHKQCFYSSASTTILEQVKMEANKIGAISYIHGIKLNFYCTNAIIFLSRVYKNSNYRLSRKFNRFSGWVYD